MKYISLDTCDSLKTYERYDNYISLETCDRYDNYIGLSVKKKRPPPRRSHPAPLTLVNMITPSRLQALVVINLRYSRLTDISARDRISTFD